MDSKDTLSEHSLENSIYCVGIKKKYFEIVIIIFMHLRLFDFF